MPAAATTTTTTGENSLASTAAWPTTREPMMLTLWPLSWGIRSPASCKISKASNSSTTSRGGDTGTLWRAAEMDSARAVGMRPKWKAAMEIYPAGSSRLMITDR